METIEKISRRDFLRSGLVGAVAGTFIGDSAFAEKTDSKHEEAFKRGIIVNPDFNIGLFLCRDINDRKLTRSDSYLDNFSDINRRGRLVSENGSISYLDYPTYDRDEKLSIVIYNPDFKSYKLKLTIIKRNEKELSTKEAKDVKEKVKKDYPNILKEYPYLRKIMDQDGFNEDESVMINRIIRHEFPSGSGFWGIGKSGKVVEYDWEEKVFERDSKLKECHKFFSFSEEYFENGVYLASLDIDHKEATHAGVAGLPFVIFS